MHCCDVNTLAYQPCQIGHMGLDVVHVICGDSWECFHGQPADLPQSHGKRHHPPHTLFDFTPLQSCMNRRLNGFALLKKKEKKPCTVN